MIVVWIAVAVIWIIAGTLAVLFVAGGARRRTPCAPSRRFASGRVSVQPDPMHSSVVGRALDLPDNRPRSRSYRPVTDGER